MSTRTPGLLPALVIALLASGAAEAGVTGLSLKGGLSLATFHGDLPFSPLVPNDYRSAGGGGLAVTFGTGAWLFQPEVLYVSKGTSLRRSELTDAGGSVVGTIETNLVVNYLEVPLLARLGFRSQGTVSPYLIGGPTVGFRTSQDYQVAGAIQSSNEIGFFHPMDLGVALGSGFELGRGAHRGLFEVRYTIGLITATRDLAVANQPMAVLGSDARNGNLLVMAGLAFQQ